MNLILLIALFALSGFFGTSPSAANYDNDTIFPTPAILKGNVAFWTKIYTEIPMKDGLLHDRDYPMVIFERLTADGSSNTVKQKKRQISDALTKITTSPQSEWGELEQRIFALYQKEADTSIIPGAAERIRFQQGQMERFKEGLRRSGLYLDTIRAILRTHRVPLRLAYLPHVESSFNTEAYSKVGAAGLWQFMRGTGKLYGMRIDYTIDERRDPVTASTAAAKYLSSSYDVLGTWPLAITSYNHGVYGMKRAVAQTGSKDLGVIIQNYKSKSFQFASSNFYGCFLAASYIAENHARFFPDVALYAPLTYADFTISHYINADDFCRFMGLSQDELMHLNPAVRPAVFSKHQQLPKGFVLHIPGTLSTTEIAAKYQTIPDSLKKSAPPRPQYYRVNKGDNLYAIATRLGVPVADLAFENNITKFNRIRAGQVLRVPAKAGSAVAIASAAAIEPAADQTPSSFPQVATVAPVAKNSTPEAAKPKPVTSEAVEEIAQAEDARSVPPEEIAAAEIEVPEKQLPTAKAAASQAKPDQTTQQQANAQTAQLSDALKEIAFAPAIADTVKTSGSSRPRVASAFDVAIYNLDATLSPVGTSARIVVSIDETIGHYADWLGIPTWRIRKLNDMGRRSNINVNRPITIPIDRPDALDQFVAARLEYHMAIEEDFYAQFMVTEATSYKLKRGENLWDICNNSENPLPLWLLAKYNQHLDLSTLFAGAELWIPQVRELTDAEMQQNSSGATNPPQPLPIRVHLKAPVLTP